MKQIQNNKLVKLTIDSYSDRERKSNLGSFKVLVNPSTLSVQHKNQYYKHQGINTSAAEALYQHTIPQELELELIIDMTIVNKDTRAHSTTEKIEKFFKLFVMNGDIHQPPFLKIHWGEMKWGWNGNQSAFDCRISSINVTYTLFARNGSPLRAILKTIFREDIADKKRINLEKKNSPDLTHTRIVTTDSSLPLFAQQIYQDPLLYIKIAQHNKVDNIRAIEPGTTLYFPPIVHDEIGQSK